MNATSGLSGHDAAAAERGHVRRRLAEPVAQDREVVRAEVPDDADVGLVQAEVDAARRDEVDARRARRASISSRITSHRRAVEERVAGHEHEPALVGELDQLARLRGRGGERLLDEHVLAGLERAQPRARSASRPASRSRPRRSSRPRGCRRSWSCRGRPGSGARSRRAARGRVADAGELGLVELVEVADEVRAPVAEADDGDAHGAHRRTARLPFTRRSRRSPSAGRPERRAAAGARGRGRATSRARRRRPCRAPRRTSSARAPSPARAR